jgi:hypothetical protein
MSLQNPMDDPAPLFALVMNAVVETAAGAIQRFQDKVTDVAAAIGERANSAVAAVKGAVDDFRVTPGGDKTEEPAVARSREKEIAIEAPALPEKAMSAAHSVVKAPEIVSDAVHIDNSVAVSPVAVAAVKQQAQGIGM